MPLSAPEAKTWRPYPKGRLLWVTLAFVLGIFGGTVWFVSVREDQEIKPGIIRRDGEILQAVMLMQQLSEQHDDPDFSMKDEASQFELLLKASRLKGVIGARLFDPHGHFVMAFPENVVRREISPADFAQLQLLRPVSRFDPALELRSTHFLDQGQSGAVGPVPVLDVLVPLHDHKGSELLGVAQFLIDGAPLAERLEQIRRAEIRQSWLVFGVGSTLIALVLGWALSRLQHRTEMLLKANRELALAAKTNAVGAISAHLIHGLKSPLFGVQSLLAAHLAEETGEPDAGRQVALQTTRRMRETINRIMGMLRDQQGMDELARPLAELADALREQFHALARERQVRLEVAEMPALELPAQVANLVLLILTNLLQNAVEATSTGGRVQLKVTYQPGRTVNFEVRDQGPGLAQEIRNDLFLPCESTKAGGGGVGLSISKQLANHLGAELDLIESGQLGAVFVLRLPARHVLGGEGDVFRPAETGLLV